MGILKGSVAIKAGVQIIHQFWMREDDEYKMRNYIGMPVRAEFYEAPNPYGLPYATQFTKLAREKREKTWPKRRVTSIEENFKEEFKSDCSFYRMQIKDYEKVAPILYHMMSIAAQERLMHNDLAACANKAVKIGQQMMNKKGNKYARL